MNKRTIFGTLILIMCSILNLKGQVTTRPDSLAIIETARNYADGFYSGDPVRMEKAIQPDLNKVCPVLMPQTGKTYLMYSTYSGLIELTRAKAGALEESKRKTRIFVLRINEDVACAKVTSASFNDYLQMVRIDDQWKIVNVLWTWGEDSPNRKPDPDFKGLKEKNAVEGVVKAMIEGIYSADPEIVSKCLHPESRRATLMQMPTTGNYMVQRDASGGIIEATRAKLGALEKGKWDISVAMLDCMDGIAMAEMKIPSGWNYCQLAKLDGEWKIVNILRKIARKP